MLVLFVVVLYRQQVDKKYIANTENNMTSSKEQPKICGELFAIKSTTQLIRSSVFYTDKYN